MSKKIPCGGFTFNEDEFEFLNGELNLKQGAGGEATKLEGEATGAIDMMGHAIVGAEKISTNGPAPVFVGSTIEPKGTKGARLTATNAGELAAVKPDTQDTYVPIHVGTPLNVSHATTKKYVDDIEDVLTAQMPDKVGEYLATPAGQSMLEACAKPGAPGKDGANGLDGASIHVTTQSLVSQGSGELNDLTGANVKVGDVVLDADGVLYNIATVTENQYTVGDEITKLIKSPITENLPIVSGASVVYGGKYYMTSDGIVDVTFEIALDNADLVTSKRVIATLPSGYRPSHTVAAPVTIQLKDGNREAASLYCGTDGQITLSTNVDTTQILRITSAFAFVAK